MRLLVCGSRKFGNPRYKEGDELIRDIVLMHSVLNGVTATVDVELIIQGGAHGADDLAHNWADSAGLRVVTFPADWDEYGRRAGFLRNQQMLDEGKPNLVIAFYSGNERSAGTAMMADIARRAGVQTWEIFS
jgi:hypothetical protein